MASLYVENKCYVYNANFVSRTDLVKELDLPIGTECRIKHCPQDSLPDEFYVVEEENGYRWMAPKK